MHNSLQGSSEAKAGSTRCLSLWGSAGENCYNTSQHTVEQIATETLRFKTWAVKCTPSKKLKLHRVPNSRTSLSFKAGERMSTHAHDWLAEAGIGSGHPVLWPAWPIMRPPHLLRPIRCTFCQGRQLRGRQLAISSWKSTHLIPAEREEGGGGRGLSEDLRQRAPHPSTPNPLQRVNGRVV